MQLYSVWFQLRHANTVDIGWALACARDETNAKEIVIGRFASDAAMLTRCGVKRIRTSTFLLERKTFVKPLDIAAAPEPAGPGQRR